MSETSTRVLFVQGGGERAGAELVLLALLRQLTDRVDAHVAFLARGPFVEEVRETTNATVHELVPVGRLRDIAALGRSVRSLRRAIEMIDPAVVQATGETMSIYAGLAARPSRRPVVAWLHDSPAQRDALGTALTQLALALTPKAKVVTCSSWLADAFNRRLRLGAVAIPNGIELERLPTEATTRVGLRSELGFPPDAVVFGHVGRLTRWKGTIDFIDAAATLGATPGGERARFLVVGGALYAESGDLEGELRARAAAAGLRDRIAFTGFRDDALELMAGCDVVVHCSTRADPFPTVILEGMALGRAVIATRTRGPEESLTEGVTGLLVAPRDPAGLAAAMASLLDPECRERLGAAAQAEARRRFDAGRMALEFEQLWARLAGGAGS